MPPSIRLVLAALALLLTTVALPAQTRLNSIFNTHMVLQRNHVIPVWGTDKPGTKVTVTLDTTTLSTTTEKDGNWSVQFLSRPASAIGINLTVVGSTKVVFTDILVGEVWIAAGQSNMDWAFFWGTGVLNQEAEEEAANYPSIRDCKIGTGAQPEAQETTKAPWIVCTARTPGGGSFSGGISYFTATGYFFARNLYQTLHVPIGLINASLGGTMIEGWLDPTTASMFPSIAHRWEYGVQAWNKKEASFLAADQSWQAQKAAAAILGLPFTTPEPAAPKSLTNNITRPCGLYNQMIYPWLGFPVKGVIWYQGENNVTRATEYKQIFPEFIKGWRNELGLGDIPFYWVQLSNYDYSGSANGTQWAYLREAQTSTLSVPNTGEAITIDIGNPSNIHLEDKQDVGLRLALLALRYTYGMQSIGAIGPLFDHAVFGPKNITVYFKNIPARLAKLQPKPWLVLTKPLVPASDLGGFEVAGADKVFHPAEAHLNPGQITVNVTCPAGVTNPVALRYAWRNDPRGLVLGGPDGLPLRPFRTDDWVESSTETALPYPSVELPRPNTPIDTNP